MEKAPRSCDTFVVLPSLTKSGNIIFGKNSDRPSDEIQEVVYYKGGTRGDTVKCTYITIAEHNGPINSVILSKPVWMWGAEMGANDHNVVVGNEAVWTKYNQDDGDASKERLIGMDLVRLGLERGNSAEEALDAITSLLEKYGQGGACSENDNSLIYHNSFIIADSNVAWVLETSGNLWAAEKIETGYRNISNGLTIKTKIDKHSEKLPEVAKSLNLWDGKGCFNFYECFAAGDSKRQAAGEKLLAELTQEAKFDIQSMFQILRDKDSGICACGSFATQGSQVSSLSNKEPSVHWFTATPDPSESVFKPFVFTPNAKISTQTAQSKDSGVREHNLYKLHAKNNESPNKETILKLLREMENQCVVEMNEMLNKLKLGSTSIDEFDELMKDCVETEVKFYR